MSSFDISLSKDPFLFLSQLVDRINERTRTSFLNRISQTKRQTNLEKLWQIVEWHFTDKINNK